MAHTPSTAPPPCARRVLAPVLAQPHRKAFVARVCIARSKLARAAGVFLQVTGGHFAALQSRLFNRAARCSAIT